MCRPQQATLFVLEMSNVLKSKLIWSSSTLCPSLREEIVLTVEAILT